MLKVLKDGPQLRTSLMKYGNTSFKVYRKRLADWLLQGLIEECDDMDKSVQLTEKGWKLLKSYETLMEMTLE